MNANDKKARMEDKVAKLLRQAEDVAGTPEEGMFQARAFDLLAKYGLDEAKIRADMGQEQAGVEADAVEVYVATGKYIPMQVTLLGQLANSLHCRVVQYGVKGKIRCILYGLPEHTSRVLFVYELLRPQMLRQVELAKPMYYLDSGKLRIYRRSFMVGYIAETSRRLAIQEQRVASEGGALVLYQSADQKAVAKMEEAHGDSLKEKKTRGQLDPEGYIRGEIEGRRARMNDSSELT